MQGRGYQRVNTLISLGAQKCQRNAWDIPAVGGNNAQDHWWLGVGRAVISSLSSPFLLYPRNPSLHPGENPLFTLPFSSPEVTVSRKWREGVSPKATYKVFVCFLVLQYLQMALANTTVMYPRRLRSNMEPSVTVNGTYHADEEYMFSRSTWYVILGLREETRDEKKVS